MKGLVNLMETLTIKDIACVLLHTKPFNNGEDEREWMLIRNTFVKVIEEKYPDKIIDIMLEFNKIVEKVE